MPWGAPNTAGVCLTTMSVLLATIQSMILTTTSLPDGGPPIPVAVTGQGTYDFAVESRQVFSHLIGDYIDFPDNGTTLIVTQVVS